MSVSKYLWKYSCKKMGEKFLTAVWEKIFLKGEGGIGLKTEKVGKCFHSKTFERIG